VECTTGDIGHLLIIFKSNLNWHMLGEWIAITQLTFVAGAETKQTSFTTMFIFAQDVSSGGSEGELLDF